MVNCKRSLPSNSPSKGGRNRGKRGRRFLKFLPVKACKRSIPPSPPSKGGRNKDRDRRRFLKFLPVKPCKRSIPPSPPSKGGRNKDRDNRRFWLLSNTPKVHRKKDNTTLQFPPFLRGG